jgi:hypothetical protein
MAIGFPTKANWAAGDVLTASAMDDLAGTVNTVQYLKPWNQVLNSNMSVWQRGTNISIASGTQAYAADRWQAQGGVNAITVSRQSTNDTTLLPNIQYCSRVQRNAGQTSTNSVIYVQSFETINSIPYAGKQVTLSFYARAGANFSSSSNFLTCYVITGTGTDQNRCTGTYTGDNSSVGVSVNLTSSWQRFTLTGTLAATTTELATYFNYTPSGTAGANDYFEITGIQLEQGSIANTYQPNQSTFQGELSACQRYYFRYGSDATYLYAGFGSGSGASGTQATIIVQHPVPMRVNPTSADFATIGLVDGVNGIVSVTSVTLAQLNQFQTTILANAASGITQYRWYRLSTNNSASGYFGLSAEL